jgi:hypothetical protein
MLNVNLILIEKYEIFFFGGNLDPPTVTVNNDLIQSEPHQNVTIECHASSRPFARISWEKNGKMIEENKTTNTRVNQTMSTSRLTIQVDI